MKNATNYKNFLRQILRLTEKYKKTANEFKKAVAESPVETLEYQIRWLSDDVVKASIILRELSDLQEFIKKLALKYYEGTAESFDKLVDDVIYILKGRIECHKNNQKYTSIMNSTCMYTNAVGVSEYKARWQLIEIFEESILILNEK